MTPLVREMAALVPEPESAHWFDIGVIDAAVPAQRIAWDDVRHLPYARTVTVFVTDKGSRCACWMAAGDHSITMAYLMQDPGQRPKFSEPIAITERAGELEVVTATGGDGRSAARVLCTVAQRLQSQRHAYRPEPAGTPAQNRKRMMKGKRPLFVWHTVTIGPRPEPQGSKGGTHASPRLHERRGHWRNMPSGKRVWVRDCKVGDASRGVVFKDYKIKEAA